MKTLIFTGLITFFLLYTIADVTYPFLNDQNYFSMNFGFKKMGNRINSHKYFFLYNDCTNEYAIKSDKDNNEYLLVWRDLYGGCFSLQSVLLEDATKFKDTTEAKRWLWIYGYYKHKEDSTSLSEGDKLIKEYEAEEAEKRKHIDSCKDIFKPLTK